MVTPDDPGALSFGGRLPPLPLIFRGEYGGDQGTLTSAVATFLRLARRRFACYWRTKGVHEADLHTGRCRYCKREWANLYPPAGGGDRLTMTARAQAAGRTLRDRLSFRKHKQAPLTNEPPPASSASHHRDRAAS